MLVKISYTFIPLYRFLPHPERSRRVKEKRADTFFFASAAGGREIFSFTKFEDFSVAIASSK